LHAAGRRAREAVETARAAVAELLGAAGEEIIFTSGGTEANNLALTGTVRCPGGRLVISSIEHPAVIEPAAALEKLGVSVRRIDPEPSGRINEDAACDALDERTDLISIILANNETGCLQPVRAVADGAHLRRVRLHTDAVQAIGKIPVDVHALGIDLLTLSAHKIGGPKGAGALWARDGRFPRSILHGGGQERGVRAGTENVAAIVGFGRAAELAHSRAGAYAETVGPLRRLLETGITERVPRARVIGDSVERVANTSCVAFEGLEATALVQLLDLKGVAASTGAACEVASEEISHVLRAMRVPDGIARGAVRFSLGFHTTEAEIIEAIGRISDAVAELGEL
jgi:cysteine desulfurase